MGGCGWSETLIHLSSALLELLLGAELVLTQLLRANLCQGSPSTGIAVHQPVGARGWPQCNAICTWHREPAAAALTSSGWTFVQPSLGKRAPTKGAGW